LRRNPIHTLKPPTKAIMQALLLFLAMSEPSPRALMVAGTISLGLLAMFLRHKLG
jgi:energy-coupling factor transporter transmembrane protein EcfT